MKATVSLSLKDPKKVSSALRAQFMKNKQRFSFYPGTVIPSRYWLPNSQMVSSKYGDHELTNQYLRNWIRELHRIINEMEANMIVLNEDTIRRELDKAMGKNAPVQAYDMPKDFIDFMSRYIKSKKRKRQDVQKLDQTRKLVILANNLTTKNTLEAWEALSVKEKSLSELKAHYKLPFEKINLEFIEHFRDYLYAAQYKKTIKGVEMMVNYKQNTIDKQIKGIKQFILAAIEKKYVEHFTWTSIKAEMNETDSVITDFDEIQAIYNTPLSNEKEIKVRDKYVLNTFLGLRYSDLNRLDEHLFRKAIVNGIERVIYTGRNKKTDRKVEFALHPTAVEILEQYNYQIPKMNACEFNSTIKEVTRKAGLTQLVRIREIRGGQKTELDFPKNELITSHTGRRSFCTNFYEHGIPVAAIMSISGHATEKEFRKYVKKAMVKLDYVTEQVFTIPKLKSPDHLRVA
jgi:hypothetical protein